MPNIIVVGIAISLAVMAGTLLAVRKNLMVQLIGAVCFLGGLYLIIKIVVPSL